jgi:hypothetical protein
MLSFLKSSVINDGDTNGGIVSNIPIPNYQRNNFLPNVSQPETESGFIRHRKLFVVPDQELIALKCLILPSTACDASLICQGTEDDTQVDATAYISWKGSGTLRDSLSAGALSSFTIISENEGIGFNPGDLLRIADDNNEDYARLMSVSWNGYIATLTFGILQLVAHDYITGAFVSSCVELSNVTSQALWFKETVYADTGMYINNLNQMIFKEKI